jgi:hypothetical protein
MTRYGVALVAGVLVVSGCTATSRSEPPVPRTSRTTVPSAPPSAPPTVSPTAEARAAQPRVPTFSRDRAMDDVRRLADDFGPRLATGPRFRRAAAWVAQRLGDIDYRVSLQRYAVPAGSSWGVPVAAGRSANVVAVPQRFDVSRPYVVVGAHLDTIAVAAGAEDNASGIAVLLETARRGTVMGLAQVVFVAFGGEEPRGEGDEDHHYGSRHYVGAMTAQERRNLVGMVSLDRVGVGPTTVAWVAGSAPAVRDDLLAAADRLGIGTAVEENTGSDHESFVGAGLPAARLGGAPYAAYHSAADVTAVVDPDQLLRTGRVLWEWLRRRAR